MEELVAKRKNTTEETKTNYLGRDRQACIMQFNRHQRPKIWVFRIFAENTVLVQVVLLLMLAVMMRSLRRGRRRRWILVDR